MASYEEGLMSDQRKCLGRKKAFVKKNKMRGMVLNTRLFRAEPESTDICSLFKGNVQT